MLGNNNGRPNQPIRRYNFRRTFSIAAQERSQAREGTLKWTEAWVDGEAFDVDQNPRGIKCGRGKKEDLISSAEKRPIGSTGLTVHGKNQQLYTQYVSCRSSRPKDEPASC